VSKQVQRAFSTEFKSSVIQRIEAGERLGAVAAELGIRRKLLYEWRAAYRALGAAGLNRKRGPKAGARKAAGSSPGHASSAAPSVPAGASSSARPGDELAEAKARIGELERVIGRQQVDLDFFRKALRLMDATPPSGIATASTRSSKK
jgi:transposase-like protein